MKSRLFALLAVCSAMCLAVPSAEASVKFKKYNVSGTAYYFALGFFESQTIPNALLDTTPAPNFTVSNIPTVGTVTGVITSETDIPSVNVAIASGTIDVGISGVNGSFTAIQIGPKVYLFASANGSFEGFPIFAFISGTGDEFFP